MQSLARKLTQVLVSRIHSSLPYMKYELVEKHERTEQDRKALGEAAPTEIKDCRSAVMHLLTRWVGELGAHALGEMDCCSLV